MKIALFVFLASLCVVALSNPVQDQEKEDLHDPNEIHKNILEAFDRLIKAGVFKPDPSRDEKSNEELLDELVSGLNSFLETPDEEQQKLIDAHPEYRQHAEDFLKFIKEYLTEEEHSDEKEDQSN